MATDIAHDWRPLDPGQAGAWADLLAAVEAHDHSDEVLGESDLIEEFADPNKDFARGSIAVSGTPRRWNSSPPRASSRHAGSTG